MNIERTVELGRNERLIVAPDTASLYEATAEMIVQAAAEAIAQRGRFSIALSGGSTPRPLYEMMATEPWRGRMDWTKTHFFWGDERWVPSTNKQSNFRMANEAWISKIPVPAANVHPIQTDRGTPGESAAQYEDVLRKILGPQPQIDFNLLGVGTNGHTASLFPGRPTLQVCDRLVVADDIPEVQMYRVTFTVPLINESRLILFLVNGKEKASVMREVLRGSRDPERLPSQLVHPTQGSLVWVADGAAAAEVH